ncbi:hypothetical protein HY640_04655 [Candidatus Woesearchaeota archaeon]|nr:hypothetical protein [Candidatus Woesearchaeota archaeon]
MKTSATIMMVLIITAIQTEAQTDEHKLILLNLEIRTNDIAKIDNMNVRYGEQTDKDKYDSTHTLLLTEDQNKIVTKTSFQPGFGTIIEYSNETSEAVPHENAYVLLRLPYTESAKYIEVYRGEKLIYREDIAGLLCNKDGKCTGFENYLSCLPDCWHNSTDGFCETKFDNICDADCKNNEDADCARKQIKPVSTEKKGQPECGDNICEEPETEQNCRQDCGAKEEQPTGQTTTESNLSLYMKAALSALFIGLITTAMFLIIRNARARKGNS